MATFLLMLLAGAAAALASGVSRRAAIPAHIAAIPAPAARRSAHAVVVRRAAAHAHANRPRLRRAPAHHGAGGTTSLSDVDWSADDIVVLPRRDERRPYHPPSR